MVKGVKALGTTLGSVAGTGLKIFNASVGAAATGVTALVSASTMAYAEYEQLVGGVETLFGAGGQSLEEYAAAVGKTTKEASMEYAALMNAQSTVMEHANEAWETAGMSANAYMSTVSGIAASLKQSTGSELEAAQAADQAIIDMADNANKMGTSMESIQNAYMGFAKQNYTMLDNLKLGYGGTKEEMQRLLEDAEKLTGIKYDINNLSDVYSAIHVIQTELGITGTTAKEASTTIEGSTNAAKAAFQNLLVGIADEEQDLDALIDNFVNAAATMVENIIPVVESSLDGVVDLIDALVPVIMDRIPALISDLLPRLAESGVNIVKALTEGISSNLPQILGSVAEIGTIMASALLEFIPELISIGAEIIVSLIEGIGENFPQIVSSAIEIIMLLTNTIIDMLPELMNIGFQMILQLIMGIAQALPELIPAIVDCVLLIIETLNAPENAMLVADAALKLIEGLALGLIDALPVLIERIPRIIKAMVDAMIEYAPEVMEAGWEMLERLEEAMNQQLIVLVGDIPGMIQKLFNKFIELSSKFTDVGKTLVEKIKTKLIETWNNLISLAPGWLQNLVDKFLSGMTAFASVGKNIVDGIWNGIKSGWDWLTGQVASLADSLYEAAKEALDINSPSKKFEYLAEMCVAGWDKGLDGFMSPNMLVNDVNASLGTIRANVAGGSGVVGGITNNQEINIYQPISTPDEMARAMRLENRYGMVKGVVYA